MQKIEELSDEQLLSSGDSDNSKKIALLISRYTNLVFATAKSLSGKADYDELVSEGFRGLLDAVRSFDSEKGLFGGFAKVCVLNRMRNALSSAKREEMNIAADVDMEIIADGIATPEERLIQHEETMEFNHQMRKMLTDLERKVFSLYLNECSYSTIARKLNISEKTVDNALYRAKQKMKSYFI